MTTEATRQAADLRGDATPTTRTRLREFSAQLPWHDDRDFDDVRRGFIATREGHALRDADGEPIMTLDPAETLHAPTPDTANPSLWRLARLNSQHGLFRVCDRVYQVRNFDISNLSVIVGDEGYIIIDPLYSAEAARAALDLVRDQLGDRPVTGMIYSHAHLDHFGGSRGVLTREEAAQRGVPVIAPEGFMEHAINENLFAGVAEARRNQFMFGALLPRDAKGQITSSLGSGLSQGVSTLVPPTTTVGTEGAEITLDGVRLRFHEASGAESPAEFHITLPDLGAACLAENVTRVMHNIYTLRGAEVRDAKRWSAIIDRCLDHLDEGVEVVFMGHHWPVFGVEEIRSFLGTQRDLYRFMHDETLRLINHGYTGHEIAEILELPPELAQHWSVRGLYGSLSHNVKAIYQRYMGWFDANPANLDPLPPGAAGPRYVAALGGSEAVLALAQSAFDDGDYRWASELLKHLLAAAPEHPGARELQASSFEQMGYQAESGPWRNVYLSGAQELRGTEDPATANPARRGDELTEAIGIDPLLDYLAIRFDGSASSSLQLVVSVDVDEERRFVIIGNGTLRAAAGLRDDETVDVAVRLDRPTLSALCRGSVDWTEIEAEVDGDRAALDEFWAALDAFSGDFALTLPHV